MHFVYRRTRSRHAILSRLGLWLIFLACAAVTALLLAGLQRMQTTFSGTRAAAPQWVTATGAPRPQTSKSTGRSAMARTEFESTFADAAESLRAARFAEAYGRFVQLADGGDVDAARIALLMHRYGPEVFGSAWDASAEQLERWRHWSETELVNERSVP